MNKNSELTNPIREANPGLYWKPPKQMTNTFSRPSCCDNLPPVLHVKDLTSLLSISHNTAYALVRSGQIRSIRIGRTYRIPRDAVAEYLCKC